MARKSQTETLLEICPLVEWLGRGFCGGCNKDLGKPHRRWCSDACQKGFVRQHQWADAKVAVLKRDGGCVRCGRDGTIPAELEAWIKWMRTLTPQGFRDPDYAAFHKWEMALLTEQREAGKYRWMSVAQRERQKVRHMKEWAALTGCHRPLWAHDFDKLCRKIHTDYALEVNHITPAMGRQAKYGCWNHLENLEILCGECHKAETRRQRAAGEFKR